MTDADERAAIRALLDAGDDVAALARLRARMRWPAGKQLPELGSWLSLLVELAERRGLDGLVEVTGAAVRDPDSPDRLYDLGYALIDFGAPSVAASVLWHCLALVGESEEVVCELVSALESALAYGDAYAILEQHAALRGRSFLCEYLYAFNAAMTGKLSITRAALAELCPDTAETESMRETIAAIIERADRVEAIAPLDTRDLRGWQYVLTGTLVSHRSPYGFDDGMHGRYAWLRDSASRVLTGVDRLVPLARQTGAPCVYAGPSRDDEILGHVVAARLGLPLMPWPAIGTPAPGLIAIYDLGAMAPGDLGRVVERKPDQILYAHASPWTHDVAVAPDVTTLLYESLVAAWGEKLVAAPGGGDELVREPPDGREPSAIAAEIVAGTGLDADEVIFDELERWTALAAAAWPPAAGRRSRLWAGGPVPSNRFS